MWPAHDRCAGGFRFVNGAHRVGKHPFPGLSGCPMNVEYLRLSIFDIPGKCSCGSDGAIYQEEYRPLPAFAVVRTDGKGEITANVLLQDL